MANMLMSDNGRTTAMDEEDRKERIRQLQLAAAKKNAAPLAVQKQQPAPSKENVAPAPQTQSPDLKAANIKAAAQGLQQLQAQKDSETGVAGGAVQGGLSMAPTMNPYAIAGGAAAGALLGGMQAKAAKKKREREARAKAFENIATIEQTRAANVQSALQTLMSGYGQSFNPTFVRL